MGGWGWGVCGTMHCPHPALKGGVFLPSALEKFSREQDIQQSPLVVDEYYFCSAFKVQTILEVLSLYLLHFVIRTWALYVKYIHERM